MRPECADLVRATIGRLILGAPDPTSAVGDIRLHRHQRDGVERVRRLLARHRGALLADDVGLGKTYLALAVAADYRDVLVIAPASLRATWLHAAGAARVLVRFASVERIARSASATGTPDLIIVDEAHHLRSPRTRRFAVVATACRASHVLLLSATPVQNRLGDLRSLLSLFLGEHAGRMSMEELSEFIVRRLAANVDPGTVELPRVRRPVWLRPVVDVDCLDRIVGLPPPLPPADGGDGGILLTYTLVRLWASSRAALVSGLRRRLAHARAMEDALLAGRMPDRRELAAWCYADGAQQLSFPELSVQRRSVDPGPLLDQTQRHADAIRDLLAWLRSSPDPDRVRAVTLASVLDRHPDERVVAFSEFAETIATLYRELAPRGEVAMISHRGGRVAGGALARDEVLGRFSRAPTAIPEGERIRLLLSTDVLSEGVNLQSASVVVHLDLAWNPARLEQRVGRLRRIGAARTEVSVYLCAPPGAAEGMLRMESRLRAKLDAAAEMVGASDAVMPSDGAERSRAAAALREERISSILRSWRDGLPTALLAPAGDDRDEPASGMCGAVITSSAFGALVCVRHGATPTLLAVNDGRVTDRRAVIERLLVAAERGHAAPAGALRAATDRAKQAARLVQEWMAGRSVSAVIDPTSLGVAQARRQILRRADTIWSQAPRHSRARLAPLLRAARAAAATTLPADAERELSRLARASLRDDDWLDAVSSLATREPTPRDAGPAMLAVLVLCPSG